MYETFLRVARILPADGGDGMQIHVMPSALLPSVYRQTGILTISVDDYLELSLDLGPISPEVLPKLMECADRYAAVRYAVRLLSGGMYNKQQLARKLHLKGYSDMAIRHALSFVVGCGYVNEKMQIESYIRVCIRRRGYGRRKIWAVLMKRGYAQEDIKNALAMYTDEDFENSKHDFLMRKFGKLEPETKEEAEAFQRALYNHGF